MSSQPGNNFDWRSAYRDLSWSYVRSQRALDRLRFYIKQNFPHVDVGELVKSPVDTAIMLLSGLVENEPNPLLRCLRCNGVLVWRRTPLLPHPAGKWFHEDDTLDDHEVVVLWEGPDGNADIRVHSGSPRRVAHVHRAQAGAVDQAAASQDPPATGSVASATG